MKTSKSLNPSLENMIIGGYRVVEATDFETAESTVAFAKVRGAVASTYEEKESAGPEVPQEDRKIVKYARVEIIKDQTVTFTSEDVSELFFMIKGRGSSKAREKMLAALQKLDPRLASQVPPY